MWLIFSEGAEVVHACARVRARLSLSLSLCVLEVCERALAQNTISE